MLFGCVRASLRCSGKGYCGTNPLATKEVPRLPLPSLADTCTRLARKVSPFLADPKAAKTTQDAIDSLLHVEGPKLHSLLLANEQRSGYPYSYVEQYWDDMYLNGRWPLPINSNPFLTLKSDPARASMTARAAAISVAAAKFAHKVRSGALEQGFEGSRPLDMYQIPRMFGTTRVPLDRRDELRNDDSSGHCVVFCAGIPFVVPVLDPATGAVVAEADLQMQFDYIVVEAAALASSYDRTHSRGVGLFTTLERNEWAAVRRLLAQDPVNSDTLQKIDSALFAVCLDAQCDRRRTQSATSRAMLMECADNRWFDKSMAFVCGADGAAAVTFEHAWGDGAAVARFMTEMWADMTGTPPPPFCRPLESHGTLEVAACAPPAPLQWKLCEELRAKLATTATWHQRQCANVKLHTLAYQRYGKELAKAARVSPDAVVQLAFQLAHRRLHHQVASVYESCNMQFWKHGRTEAIRPVTAASTAFTAACLQSSEDGAVDEALLKAAAAAHRQECEDCQSGRGVDRHLYALECAASSLGVAAPRVSTDEGVARYRENILSTSCVSLPFIVSLGFGPVTKDGYGLGYNVQDNNIVVNCTSFADSLLHTDADAMADAISAALDRIGARLRILAPPGSRSSSCPPSVGRPSPDAPPLPPSCGAERAQGAGAGGSSSGEGCSARVFASRS